MTVGQEKDGVPDVSCSPAMVYIMKKNEDGMLERTLVPALKDNHVHEVEYRGSQKITPRQANTEFGKLHAEVAAKETQKIPGVLG